MSKLILFLMGAFVACSFKVNAQVCVTKSGNPYTYNFSSSFNETQNVVGWESQWIQAEVSGFSEFPDNSACSSQQVFFTSQAGPALEYAFSDGGVNWYNIPGNDYLQVASKISVINQGDLDVPFVDKGNKCYSVNDCASPTFATGRKTQLKIRVKRKFTGTLNESGIEVFRLYGNTDTGVTPSFVLVRGYYSFSITVPQSCELNAGQVINIDFGNISSGAFKTAGTIAQGVQPQSRSISVKCDNIAGNAQLQMRLQADQGKVSGQNVVVADENNDVGFRVTNNSGTPLRVNDVTSYIPFVLDSNARQNVTISVYPVSVTGNKPAEGPVTSRAYLRVDFP
ncbi:fimbrial-like adhesin [Serratia marcescens]|nr:fimbrial-like adhesin [Serratia marcescens]